jgi:hypothetical protein
MSDGMFLSPRTADRLKRTLQKATGDTLGPGSPPPQQIYWVAISGTTLDASGRYSGTVESYFTGSSSFVATSTVACRIQPVGGTMQLGRFYPATPAAPDSSHNSVFVALVDADEVPVGSPPTLTWWGGLINTLAQTFKGAKKFRDPLTVANQDGLGQIVLNGTGGATVLVQGFGSIGGDVTVSGHSAGVGVSATAGGAGGGISGDPSLGLGTIVGPTAFGSQGGEIDLVGYPGTAGGGSAQIVCSGTGYTAFNAGFTYGAGLFCKPAATGLGQLGTGGYIALGTGVTAMSMWCVHGSTFPEWAACDDDMVVAKTGGGSGNGDLTLAGDGSTNAAAYAVMRGLAGKKRGLDQTITISGFTYYWYGGILTPP